MTTNQPNINHLITACKKGDRSAQLKVYENYSKAMYNTSLRIVKDTFDAEDIMQESFITAFAMINDLKDISTFGAWLKRIVINNSLTFLRQHQPTTELDKVLYKIEGESNLLEYISTEVKNNHLIVKVNNNVSLQSSRNKTITVTIPYKDISEVSMAGSGNMWSKNNIKSDDFKVSLAGSGDVKLTIETQKTTAKVAGSGNLTLTGKTVDLKADIAGSGDFYGYNLNANNTNVSVVGSGNAKVVCNEDLVARVAGSGNIRYKGKPSKEDTKVSGSGSISN